MSILGIRFRPHGQTYYFLAPMEVTEGSFVVVKAEQSLALGEVLSIHESMPPGVPREPLDEVLRIATEEDCATRLENETLARQAHLFCQECIRQRKLEMKLVDVEVFHDRSKIVFYFTAPARIDFRELVKDLVREYRSRIELRQIGVRHETQMVGAVGNCGMVCCCRRFLRKFAPVTIRMAKEQNLFLNPAKISGNCGRLLCCLSYEQDNYDAFHRSCPRLGKKYQTTRGGMKVLRANMFRNTVSVLNESNEEQEFTLEEWHALEPCRPEQHSQSHPRPEKTSPALSNSLLVVSATPETVNELTPPDAAAPPEEETISADGRGVFGLAPRAGIRQLVGGEESRQGKAKRKRRKRPRAE